MSDCEGRAHGAHYPLDPEICAYTGCTSSTTATSLIDSVSSCQLAKITLFFEKFVFFGKFWLFWHFLAYFCIFWQILYSLETFCELRGHF
jgi:hypothetical protein